MFRLECKLVRRCMMAVNSDSRWSVYKEIVAESQAKARELFATKKVDPRLHLDLNRCASEGDEIGRAHV